MLKEENSLVWHTVVLNWINKFVGLSPYRDEGDLGIPGLEVDTAIPTR